MGNGLHELDGAVKTPSAVESETVQTGAETLFRNSLQNVDAEKALLGAILANNRAHERVSEYLRPGYFADPVNGQVFDAVSRLIERGQIADLVTLRSYFEQNKELNEMGGVAYLADLASMATTIINAGEYGRLIYDLYLKRQLIELGQEVVNTAFSAEVDDTAMQQIEGAEQRLYDLATTGAIEGGFRPFSDALAEALKLAEKAHKRDGSLAGVTTGFRDLDSLLGGLHPSDLVIIAGRPGMGKTALATNIAYNAAHAYLESTGQQGAVAGFYSLEMSAEQLAARIISEQSNVSSDKMRKGELSNDDFGRLVPASQDLHQTPFFIDDTPALTVSALRTRARRLKRQEKLGLIVVDYLQLISAPPGRRNDNRVQEVSEITRGLKTLAKELNVPVIALSQLSRAVEARDDKRPQLADLRESGSIEQDADVVAFIYREEYYERQRKIKRRDNESDEKFLGREQRHEERLAKVANLAEVIVAKQRHGPIGTIALHFNGEFTRFGNLETPFEESDDES